MLVRVLACGLCGSDVEKLGRSARGTVLGHEVAGVLENGARVTVMHRVPCGTCERCRAGHQSTCGEFRELRITPGGFAEQLRATHCVPLPDTLGELDGVWVEPLACVLRAAESVPRGRVLVVGAGAVGQLWIQVLRRRGDDVVSVDPRPERLAQAHMLGAETGDSDTVAATVLTAHAGINDALHRLEPGGTLLVFAAPPDDVPTALDAVYRKELRVIGSRSATPAYFRDAVELLPTLVLPEVTTLPLERFLEGVELYRRGEALKVVFTP
ncbi:MAG: alcohol dehydrogenase catalytic domain-containing protein [Thermoleophilia bacterium]|nr:alcohol dehydrogenase catalytic domain-containing protein [Thermoleophilia bacterium]